MARDLFLVDGARLLAIYPLAEPCRVYKCPPHPILETNVARGMTGKERDGSERSPAEYFRKCLGGNMGLIEGSSLHPKRRGQRKRQSTLRRTNRKRYDAYYQRREHLMTEC